MCVFVCLLSLFASFLYCYFALIYSSVRVVGNDKEQYAFEYLFFKVVILIVGTGEQEKGFSYDVGFREG